MGMSLLYGEPLVVVASAAIGMKPLAQLYHRRSVGYADAKTQMAEAQGFAVEAGFESFPFLVIFTIGVLADLKAGNVDMFQLCVVLSALSTCSMHGANMLMAKDGDTRAGSYYPEHHNLVTPSKKWQTKLGLRAR